MPPSLQHLCSDGPCPCACDSSQTLLEGIILKPSHGGRCRGGLRFGALTGLFYGAKLLSSTARNRRDMADTIYAALATGAVMGSFSARLQPLHAWLPSRDTTMHSIWDC